MSTETGIAAIIPPDQKAQGKLYGNLGVLDVMFTVVAYNGPAVVFMGFLPFIILWGNGLGAPALILVAGALLALLSTGIINMSSHMKRPGGFYAFVSAGLGRIAGMGAGFTAMLTYLAAVLSVYVLAGTALSGILVDIFGMPPVPWWVTGLVCVILVGGLGYMNIQFSAKILTIFLSLEFLLIAVYVIAVLVQGGANGIGFESFEPRNIFSGELATGALFAIMIFGGFEATVIFREEVRDPDRTIKRATYGVVALLAGTYALLAWTFINASGASVVMEVLEANVGGAPKESVREYVGDFAYICASLLLFTSAFALQLASHNILTRYVYNFSVDRVFPKALAYTHPKHVSPVKASMLISGVSVIGIIGIALANIDESILYGVVASFIAYGMIILATAVSLSIGIYMIKNKTGSLFHAIVMFVVGIIFGSALVFATIRFDYVSGLTGVGNTVLLIGCWVFIFCGVALGAYFKKKRPDIYKNIGRRDN